MFKTMINVFSGELFVVFILILLAFVITPWFGLLAVTCFIDTVNMILSYRNIETKSAQLDRLRHE